MMTANELKSLLIEWLKSNPQETPGLNMWGYPCNNQPKFKIDPDNDINATLFKYRGGYELQTNLTNVSNVEADSLPDLIAKLEKDKTWYVKFWSRILEFYDQKENKHKERYYVGYSAKGRATNLRANVFTASRNPQYGDKITRVVEYELVPTGRTIEIGQGEKPLFINLKQRKG